MQQLLADYGNENALVKVQAKHEAAQAGDTVLNLSCPHSKTCCSKFEGCMALQCSSCERFFCAYCHKGRPNNSDVDKHARECDMNQTPNGNYSASPAQLKDAQRMYRVKILRGFLRAPGLKKRVQNAIVLELESDLRDLGVDPAALLEVGGPPPDAIHVLVP